MTESGAPQPYYGVPLDHAAHGKLPDALVAALREVEVANEAMRTSDPGPFIQQWHQDPTVTLYGAWGPIEQGFDRLRETFTWVGTRFTGGEVAVTYTAIRVDGNLAVTTGFETGVTSVDHGVPSLMRLRVTHVLERDTHGRWGLVHRHADHPPVDERVSVPS